MSIVTQFHCHYFKAHITCFDVVKSRDGTLKVKVDTDLRKEGQSWRVPLQIYFVSIIIAKSIIECARCVL
jgi:hypothetical protein